MPAVVLALFGVSWILGLAVGQRVASDCSCWGHCCGRRLILQTGAWRLSLLDVGQGMAAVVQTAGHTLVFDAGTSFGDHFDAGEAVVVPYLRSLGLRHLGLLVISHPRLALLSSGFGNRFDFQRPSVMRCYARWGIEVADTARSGALTVEFDRVDGMRPLPGYRELSGLYWNRTPGP